MPTEEFTADGFPDKSEFVPPAKIRRKPDCDRRTLIPDPCDLKIDRRKKTLENNDCDTTPIVQVCPEDIGKFRIPELPVIPKVFVPQRIEPIVVPRLPDPPPPEAICNDPFSINCPEDGWLDANWAEQNLTGYTIVRDKFGGVENFKSLNIPESLLPTDPELYIAPGPEDRKFGATVDVSECSFTAATKEEANKLAMLYAMRAQKCQYCNPEITVDCLDYQELALPIGGIGYTAENTTITVDGDGTGAVLEPVINQEGTITGINIVSAGSGYKGVLVEIQGDGYGAVISTVVLGDDPCGSEIIEVIVGQTLPDPAYDPELDPPIVSRIGKVCVPECSYLSDESPEAARELAEAEAYESLDCSYQSPALDKPCPPPQVPKAGYDLPLGAFKVSIDRGTQESVTSNAEAIIDALDCIDVICPNGFPEAIVDINIYDPNEPCDDKNGSNDSFFEAHFDEDNCAYKLEGLLVLPEIPCPCGFNTSSSIDGMSVTSSNNEINTNSNCSASLDLGIEIIGNTDIDFDFDMDNCSFDLDIDLPDLAIACTNIGFGVSGGDFSVAVNEADSFSANVTVNGEACVEGEGCSLELTIPDIELEINIPCPDGMNVSGNISGGGFTSNGGGGGGGGGGECDVSFDIAPNITTDGNVQSNFSMENCDLKLDIVLPNFMLETGCESIDMGASGGEVSVEVTGPGADLFSLTADSDAEGCVIESTGDCGAAISLPNIDLVLEVPDIPCPNFAFTGDVGVCGGGITTSSPNVTVSETTPASSNVSITEINCGAVINGCITIPSYEIDVQIPDIECPQGINVSSNLSIEVGTVSTTSNILNVTPDGSPSTNIGLTQQNCKIILDGELKIPGYDISIDIPCPEGTAVSGSVGVCGGGISSNSPNVTVSETTPAASNVNVSQTNCNVVIDGCITIPSYEIDVDIPDIACPNGFTTDGSISVSGGALSVSGNYISTNSSGSANGSINLSQQNCAITLDGSITIPDYSIDLDIPEIPCANGFSTSSDISIDGGSISASSPITAQVVSSASSNISFTETDCSFEVGGSITLPDYTIDINIPCPNGISGGGSVDVSGGSITGYGPVTAQVVTSASSDVNVSINNCELEVSGSITLPDYSIDLNVPCPNGISGGGSVDVSGGSITGYGPVTAQVVTSASSDVNVSINNCQLDVSGSITLPDYSIDLNVPCPNGISGGGSVDVSGGSITGGNYVTAQVVTSASSDVNVSINNCQLDVSGSITLPDYTIDVNIPNICEDVGGSGDISIGGGDISGGTYVTANMVTSGSSNVSLSGSGCNVTLDGSITLPTYSVDVNIPNVCESINASGTASVSGGSISGGSGITVSGNSSASGNITLSTSGDCGVTLSGSIVMPSVTIDADSINCSDISGAICDGDLSTTTLSVCDSSGSTSSITVVTM
jgi:hypothetical protein